MEVDGGRHASNYGAEWLGSRKAMRRSAWFEQEFRASARPHLLIARTAKRGLNAAVQSAQHQCDFSEWWRSQLPEQMPRVSRMLMSRADRLFETLEIVSANLREFVDRIALW